MRFGLTRRATVIVGAVACTMALTAVTTYAATQQVNTAQGVTFHSVTENNAWSTESREWTDVPGAVVTVSTSSDHLVLDATFTAESKCNGPSTGWCSLRILARGPNGVDQELAPVGSDFAFDWAGSEGLQAGAMKRTSRVSFDIPGSWTAHWTVRVQARNVVNATSFWLDDWNLTVYKADPSTAS